MAADGRVHGAGGRGYGRSQRRWRTGLAKHCEAPFHGQSPPPPSHPNTHRSLRGSPVSPGCPHIPLASTAATGAPRDARCAAGARTARAQGHVYSARGKGGANNNQNKEAAAGRGARAVRAAAKRHGTGGGRLPTRACAHASDATLNDRRSSRAAPRRIRSQADAECAPSGKAQSTRRRGVDDQPHGGARRLGVPAVGDFSPHAARTVQALGEHVDADGEGRAVRRRGGRAILHFSGCGVILHFTGCVAPAEGEGHGLLRERAAPRALRGAARAVCRRARCAPWA